MTAAIKTVLIAEARERASSLLAGTDHFAALGLEKASADARMCARYVLDLADELEAERSARAAVQARAERLQAIIGQAAYEQLIRGAA